VEGGWIKLHKEDLYNLFTAPNVIRVIKTRSAHGTNKFLYEDSCFFFIRHPQSQLAPSTFSFRDKFRTRI